MSQSVPFPTSSGGPDLTWLVIAGIVLVIGGAVFATAIVSNWLIAHDSSGFYRPRWLLLAVSLCAVGATSLVIAGVQGNHERDKLTAMQAEAVQTGWHLSHADALYLAENPYGTSLFGSGDPVVITLANGRATRATLQIQGDQVYLVDGNNKPIARPANRPRPTRFESSNR